MAKDFQFQIQGLSPLLMHADNIDAADEIDAFIKKPANKGLTKPGDDRTPGWKWLGYLYVGNDSQVVMPSACLSSCLKKAGSSFKASGMKTLKDAAACGIVFIEESYELKINGKPIDLRPFEKLKSNNATIDEHKSLAAKSGFELHIIRAKLKDAKHVRVRPKFRGWSLSGQFKVTWPELEDRKVLQDLFDWAGMRCGLGDWRPASPRSPGSFGVFKAAIKEI